MTLLVYKIARESVLCFCATLTQMAGGMDTPLDILHSREDDEIQPELTAEFEPAKLDAAVTSGPPTLVPNKVTLWLPVITQLVPVAELNLGCEFDNK